ncbi:tetratricopeptide repeat protein [Alkalihalobacterium alkalinitrilicum]|uniref:tetratricopeptide repeat protein n=1 Tax=Alkalihalobacterium alkalinitrilicum TaxID=427920 RepID=UPI0009955877|nr:tetratricopeptide repeat protein [Alkalihalobacterium alkalinitrilicum]
MGKIIEAVKKIESGQVDQGLAQLAELENTSNHETKFELAEAYYSLGHLEKVKKIINDLLLLYPDEGELYTFYAELLIDLGQEDEAIEMLLEVNDDDPVYVRSLLLLADLYQMQGLDEVAEQKLLKAIEKAPDEPIVSFGLGDFYLDRGDFQKSLPHLKKAYYANVKLEEMNIALRLAEAYSGTGEYEEALKFYAEGLDQQLDIHAIFNYGYTAYQIEKYELAIDQFTTLKELDSEFSSVYPYLAKCFEALHRYEDAIKVINEGLAVDQFNEELYVHGGKLSFKMNNRDKGEEYLREVIAINPSHFEAVRTLAGFLKHEGRYEDLIDLVEHLKDIGEGDPALTWYEAVARYENDEMDKAKECFEAVKEDFTEDVDFLEEYGKFLMENGERNESLTLFKKAITLDESRLNIKELINYIEEDL